ncbi:alpha/beta hydrolase [Brevibacterium litoralis]|uniref:alpha/beta hydrolase n=1 Tax=Brevibacterium litoralis TaxID=3138935 RepID=UPI0032F0157E
MSGVYVDEERAADLARRLRDLEQPTADLHRTLSGVLEELAAAGIGDADEAPVLDHLQRVSLDAPEHASSIGRRLEYLAACERLESAFGIDVSPELAFADAEVPDVEAIGDVIDDLGEDPSATEIRTATSDLTTTDLQLLLEGHPAWIRELQGDDPPAGAFPAVGDAMRRYVLLYPDLANVDGIPAEHRYTGNRLNIVEELDDLQDLENPEPVGSDYPGPGNQAAYYEARGRWRDEVEEITPLVEFYEKLLHENPGMTGLDGEPLDSNGHQVILFDPENSRFAEVFGELPGPSFTGEGVDVGVMVPGTGASMTSIDGTSDRARNVHTDAAPVGSTPMIAWMGGPMPQDVDAATTGYAKDLGPRLTDFVSGLHLPDGVGTTASGHSYGGSVLGNALANGLDIDRAVFVNSAGMGPGVDGSEDYTNAPDLDLYNLSVPDDFINWVQPFDVHGADPDLQDDVVQVETGWNDAADPSQGVMADEAPFDSHSAPFRRGSTAYENLVSIFTGDGQVSLEQHRVETRYVGYPAVPIEVMVPHTVDTEGYEYEYHPVD